MSTTMTNPISENLDDLFVEDNNYQDTYASCKTIAENVQEEWDKFIKVSRAMVLDDEDIKGNRANSYSEFIELASELLSTKIKDVILQASLDMENYVVEIDGADSVLY